MVPESLEAFKLTVTRPGCEFDGIVKTNSAGYDLKKWFENTPQAGYGDVRTQETKVDLAVRDAHEITRDEFALEDSLLDKIAALWSQHFSARVRVEPYKINVYGPGGFFKPHKDTPEKDLVGTFLVGLGETWGDDDEPHLVVAGEKWWTIALECVAFYPDVVHEVRPVSKGYRAALALKVFRIADDGAPDAVRAGRYALVEPLVAQLRAPVGVLFQRQYGISTTELSGLDAVVLDCARKRAAASVGKLEVHVLPVLTHLQGSAQIVDDCEVEAEAKVFPLTDAHVDIIMGRGVDTAQEKIKWLEGVSGVSFFAVESMEVCGETWKRIKTEGAEVRSLCHQRVSVLMSLSQLTGNAAAPAREDSIYLSFAMIMLPTQKRKATFSASSNPRKK